MPTRTFFNLPTPKRERLLAAARAEFARVPFPHASINQIIRTAGIPRGSFYMYFEDKSDLFTHLIQEYIHMAIQAVTQLLVRSQGDLFAFVPALYDHSLASAQDPRWRAAYDDVLQIVSQNGAALVGSLLEQSTDAVCDVFQAATDRSLLDLRGERDLEDDLSILLPLSLSAVKDGLLSSDPAAVRGRLMNTLDILARGMAAKPVMKEKQNGTD